MKDKPRVLDLFCGAGGLSKGFEEANFDIIAGVDAKKIFLETFKENHSEAKAIKANLFEEGPKEVFEKGDFKEKDVDVVIGGPPCKGFSIAGKRDPEDERNTLVDKFIDFVEHARPKIFVMENVPSIRSMKDGKFYRSALSRYKDLGYSVKCKVLNSADYGVPQKRRRAIFIGRKDGKMPKFPKRTHAPRKQDTLNQKNLKPYKTVKEAILNKDFSNLPNHEKTSHSKEMKEKISKVKPGESLYESFGDSWRRLEKDKPSITIKENHNAPFIHPEEDRVGTVRECASLQSFPDDFEFKGPKSQQLKMVGNAVPPLLSRKIARKVKEQLKEIKQEN